MQNMSLGRALVAVCALAVAAPSLASAQSLYRDGGPGASLFTDQRARAANDIVTILIVEESSSSRSANTEVRKESSRSAAVKEFPTVFDQPTKGLVRGLSDTPKTKLSGFMEESFGIDASAKGNHQGKGSIDRSDRVKGQIAAKVVKVLDNGNLVLEGRRSVLVNNETQVITISGIVRPQDVTASNTVLSSQIADAEIQMEGRGILADAQRPGVLYRLLDWLRIF